MNCEFIAVGTEILLGQILNTNAKFISEELANLGINMYYQTVVGDNEERLTNAVHAALSRADMIITSAGLGPTNDDITKEVVAKAMDIPLELDDESMRRIEERFKVMHRDFNYDIQKKQAYMPKGCCILPNNNGTAPGCIIEKDGKVIVVLPGPPKELKPMYLESVRPYLAGFSKDMLYSRVIKIFGMGEAAVEEIFGEEMKTAQNPTMAPYAKQGETTLRVTAKCHEENEGKQLVEAKMAQIVERLGDVVYSTNDETLPQTVVKLLTEKKKAIALAESCTGGLVATSITDVPGASAVFAEGYVTYSNEAKMKNLGVAEDTLKAHGAVSEQTAGEMAKGLKVRSGADIAVSITGIAGPDGATSEKPLGLVYVGISAGEKTYVKELHLFGTRENVRYTAMLNACDLVRRVLSDLPLD